MAEVTLRNISKVFGHHPETVPAVNRVSLEIAEGQTVALLGPSGCGKTTILRLIAGLEWPTAGEIHIAGRNVTRCPPAQRDVGMVFQNYALYPHLTVWDNMAFGLKARGVDRKIRTERIRQVAAALEIQGLVGRRPATLSGGEQQRVALGRALVREPAVVLMDEPLAALDAKLRRQTRGELKRVLRRLQKSVLYVTHDQEEASCLGDLVAVMAPGIVLQVGRPQDVYLRPASTAVARLIGVPPINLIEARIERVDGRLTACSTDGRFPLPPWFSARQSASVVLGVRPDTLTIGPRRDGVSSLEVRIENVERLGPYTDLQATTRSGKPLLARLTGDHEVREQEVTQMCFDDSRTLYFESGDEGAAINASRTGAVR